MAGGNDFLRSPRQASEIFSLDGARAPRQKNLFAVNFRRAGDGNTTGSGANAWTKEMGFLVKSVDRPSIDPKTEELNQYNKKRVVHTGYKIGTTRITLYDTADAMVLGMWNDWAKHYFGDFRHAAQASTDWAYDVTLNEFKDTAKGGYGFAPTAAANAESEFNSQFFLETVSIYQVFGGKYIQMDLIHPKITSFAPDGLDYSVSDVALYTMTLACEAVVYVNDAKPQPLLGNPFLKEAFQSSGLFNGLVLDVPAPSKKSSDGVGTATPVATASAVPAFQNAVQSENSTLRSYTNSTSGGTLSAYGSYNFGSLSSNAVPAPNAASVTRDLSVSALTNAPLASALSLSSTASRPGLNPNPPGETAQAPRYIDQASLDVARSAISAIGAGILSPGQQIDGDMRAIIDAAAFAVLAAGLASGKSPREQVYNRHITEDEVINTWNSASGSQGLALTAQVCGIMNAQRCPSSQIGFNDRNKVPAQPVSVRSNSYRPNREVLPPPKAT